MSYADANFKSGGNAEANAFAAQENIDPTKIVNKGAELGVANADVASDEDLTAQEQNTQAGAFGGGGGQDNVFTQIDV
jgi:hypothetical protein